jgi:hypothetical protein
MNTIAVGPRDEVASWFTGGTGVAKPRVCRGVSGNEVADVNLEIVLPEARFARYFKGFVTAIVLEETRQI